MRRRCRRQGTGPAARRRGIAGNTIGHDCVSSGAVPRRTWKTLMEVEERANEAIAQLNGV